MMWTAKSAHSPQHHLIALNAIAYTSLLINKNKIIWIGRKLVFWTLNLWNCECRTCTHEGRCIFRKVQNTTLTNVESSFYFMNFIIVIGAIEANVLSGISCVTCVASMFVWPISVDATLSTIVIAMSYIRIPSTLNRWTLGYYHVFVSLRRDDGWGPSWNFCTFPPMEISDAEKSMSPLFFTRILSRIFHWKRMHITDGKLLTIFKCWFAFKHVCFGNDFAASIISRLGNLDAICG